MVVSFIYFSPDTFWLFLLILYFGDIWVINNPKFQAKRKRKQYVTGRQGFKEHA